MLFLYFLEFFYRAKTSQCHSGELCVLSCWGSKKKTEKKQLKSRFDPLTVTCCVSFQKTESSSSACSTSSSRRTTCGASSSPSAASRSAPSSEAPTATARVSPCNCAPTPSTLSPSNRGRLLPLVWPFQTLETFTRFSLRAHNECWLLLVPW